jgi:uncharacterized protein involved in exopolysaccharide biosynthesis
LLEMIGMQRTEGVPGRPADLPIADDEIPVLRVAVPLARRWRLVAVATAIGAALALLATVLIPSRFTAHTSFTVEASGPGIQIPSGLGGIAGALGLSLLASSSNNPNPDYLVALTRSDSVRKIVVRSRFDESGAYAPERGTPLVDLLNVRGKSPREREEKAMKKLSRMIDAGVDRKTDIVTIEVTDRSPVRAAAITNRLLELLNAFNVERRRVRSRLQRESAERSLHEAQAELRAAEARFEEFLVRNKVYRAPPLMVEYGRLQRNIDMKQNVVETLVRSYEESRIAEAGDVPVVSVIDHGEPPARRSFPKWWIFLPAGLILGLVVGSVLAVVLEAKRSWTVSRQPPYVAPRETGRVRAPAIRRPEGDQLPATVD